MAEDDNEHLVRFAFVVVGVAACLAVLALYKVIKYLLKRRRKKNKRKAQSKPEAIELQDRPLPHFPPGCSTNDPDNDYEDDTYENRVVDSAVNNRRYSSGPDKSQRPGTGITRVPSAASSNAEYDVVQETTGSIRVQSEVTSGNADRIVEEMEYEDVDDKSATKRQSISSIEVEAARHVRGATFNRGRTSFEKIAEPDDLRQLRRTHSSIKEREDAGVADNEDTVMENTMYTPFEETVTSDNETNHPGSETKSAQPLMNVEEDSEVVVDNNNYVPFETETPKSVPNVTQGSEMIYCTAKSIEEAVDESSKSNSVLSDTNVNHNDDCELDDSIYCAGVRISCEDDIYCDGQVIQDGNCIGRISTISESHPEEGNVFVDKPLNNNAQKDKMAIRDLPRFSTSDITNEVSIL